MRKLNVNGKVREFDGDENKPLLWAIREDLGLTGTKYGCGISQCGACTIHIDGEAVRACTYPVGALEGGEKITMAVAALLKDNPNASDEDIDNEITNICRCGTFARVRKGIHLAKKKR